MSQNQKPFTFECPHCGHEKSQEDQRFVGFEFPCDQCGKKYVVPEPNVDTAKNKSKIPSKPTFCNKNDRRQIVLGGPQREKQATKSTTANKRALSKTNNAEVGKAETEIDPSQIEIIDEVAEALVKSESPTSHTKTDRPGKPQSRSNEPIRVSKDPVSEIDQSGAAKSQAPLRWSAISIAGLLVLAAWLGGVFAPEIRSIYADDPDEQQQQKLTEQQNQLDEIDRKLDRILELKLIQVLTRLEAKIEAENDAASVPSTEDDPAIPNAQTTSQDVADPSEPLASVNVSAAPNGSAPPEQIDEPPAEEVAEGEAVSRILEEIKTAQTRDRDLLLKQLADLQVQLEELSKQSNELEMQIVKSEQVGRAERADLQLLTENQLKPIAAQLQLLKSQNDELQGRLDRLTEALQLPLDDRLPSTVVMYDGGRRMAEYHYSEVKQAVLACFTASIRQTPLRQIGIVHNVGSEPERLIPLKRNYLVDLPGHREKIGRTRTAASDESDWVLGVRDSFNQLVLTPENRPRRLVFITAKPLRESVDSDAWQELIAQTERHKIECWCIQLLRDGDTASPKLVQLATQSGGEFIAVAGEGGTDRDDVPMRLERILYRALHLSEPRESGIEED